MFEIITLDYARLAGLAHYFTGELCLRGHRTQRRVGNGTCIECARERAAGWYEKNKQRAIDAQRVWWQGRDVEITRARDAKYRQKNRVRIRECQRAWEGKEENKEKKKKWGQAYRAKYPERERQRAQRRRDANPAKFRAYAAARRARKRKAEGTYTEMDVERISRLQKCRCAICRTSLKRGYHIDHIVPLIRGGTNWPSNIQMLCQRCNQRKSGRDQMEFMRDAGWLL